MPQAISSRVSVHLHVLFWNCLKQNKNNEIKLQNILANPASPSATVLVLANGLCLLGCIWCIEMCPKKQCSGSINWMGLCLFLGYRKTYCLGTVYCIIWGQYGVGHCIQYYGSYRIKLFSYHLMNFMAHYIALFGFYLGMYIIYMEVSFEYCKAQLYGQYKGISFRHYIALYYIKALFKMSSPFLQTATFTAIWSNHM